MNRLLELFTKTIYLLSAVLAGVCLFSAALSMDASNNVLNPDFHKHLFQKNNIYLHTQNVIDSSMADFINNLKKYSIQNFDQHSDIFNVIQKSTTPEMIKLNLDSIRNGLFEYFKGNRRFLPDIYLNTQVNNENSQNNISNAQGDTLSKALTKIDKINLSLILLYINRNDITDRLFAAKFLYYLISLIPGYSLLFYCLFFLICFALSRKIIDITRWVSVTFMICGVLTLLTGVVLLVYAYFILPKNIYPLATSIPLQTDVIISYIRDCSNSISRFTFLSGAAFLLLAAVMIFLPRTSASLFNESFHSTDNYHKNRLIIKHAVSSFLFLVIISAIFYKIYMFNTVFDENDFSVAISKIVHSNTITQVISAKDTAIYSLQIKLVDKETNKPIPDTQINISGDSSLHKKSYNTTETTDADGIAKFPMDKGSFRVSFISAYFPNQYQLPSPFYTDLKSAGTTIITVQLEAIPEEDDHNWGIAEVEVFDKDNRPLSNLSLSVEGMIVAPGYPNDIFSITNSEGIAVFRLGEGNYKIGFISSKLPEQYNLPPLLDVTVKNNTITRYTLRLVDKKKP